MGWRHPEHEDMGAWPLLSFFSWGLQRPKPAERNSTRKGTADFPRVKVVTEPIPLDKVQSVAASSRPFARQNVLDEIVWRVHASALARFVESVALEKIEVILPAEIPLKIWSNLMAHRILHRIVDFTVEVFVVARIGFVARCDRTVLALP